MIRAALLVVLGVVVLVVAGHAVARALVSWRSERRRVRAVRTAQREADLREQAARREARERAKDAIEDAAYRDEPNVRERAREHPLGWAVVALPGALCAARLFSSGDRSDGWAVDRYDAEACAWQIVPYGDPLHAQAVAALGG